MSVCLEKGHWLNKPESPVTTKDSLTFNTPPNSDFWQRTYYGFRNDNAPAFLLNVSNNFSLTLRCDFNYQHLFDQSGVCIYLDSENWFKAGLEYENNSILRLGSVVTNSGYSDWATVDIPHTHQYWYRLHRRGPDFLIESSADGVRFQQMRIFHLHALGDTPVCTVDSDVPSCQVATIPVGFYACSPGNSSFTAGFSEIDVNDCQWKKHSN